MAHRAGSSSRTFLDRSGIERGDGSSSGIAQGAGSSSGIAYGVGGSSIPAHGAESTSGTAQAAESSTDPVHGADSPSAPAQGADSSSAAAQRAGGSSRTSQLHRRLHDAERHAAQLEERLKAVKAGRRRRLASSFAQWAERAGRRRDLIEWTARQVARATNSTHSRPNENHDPESGGARRRELIEWTGPVRAWSLGSRCRPRPDPTLTWTRAQVREISRSVLRRWQHVAIESKRRGRAERRRRHCQAELRSLLWS